MNKAVRFLEKDVERAYYVLGLRISQALIETLFQRDYKTISAWIRYVIDAINDVNHLSMSPSPASRSMAMSLGALVNQLQLYPPPQRASKGTKGTKASKSTKGTKASKGMTKNKDDFELYHDVFLTLLRLEYTQRASAHNLSLDAYNAFLLGIVTCWANTDESPELREIVATLPIAANVVANGIYDFLLVDVQEYWTQGLTENITSAGELVQESKPGMLDSILELPNDGFDKWFNLERALMRASLSERTVKESPAAEQREPESTVLCCDISFDKQTGQFRRFASTDPIPFNTGKLGSKTRKVFQRLAEAKDGSQTASKLLVEWGNTPNKSTMQNLKQTVARLNKTIGVARLFISQEAGVFQLKDESKRDVR
jgi:hypothetical protein